MLDGFVIQAPGATVSPQIYLNDVYEVYLETESFPKAMHIMCEILVDEITRTDDLDARSIIENAEERIVFQLINTEKNKELLKTVPHRNFLDLSIIFVVSVNVSEANSYGSSEFLTVLQRRWDGPKNNYSKWHGRTRSLFSRLRLIPCVISS